MSTQYLLADTQRKTQELHDGVLVNYWSNDNHQQMSGIAHRCCSSNFNLVREATYRDFSALGYVCVFCRCPVSKGGAR